VALITNRFQKSPVAENASGSGKSSWMVASRGSANMNLFGWQSSSFQNHKTQ
jgi:microcompartment protein CcmK/EutM